MTKAEIEEFVKNTVIDFIASNYDSNQNFVDMGADSLDAVELIMSVEEQYDITISDTEAENIKTPKDLINVIIEKLKADGRPVTE